jgi:hypothetical protein
VKRDLCSHRPRPKHRHRVEDHARAFFVATPLTNRSMTASASAMSE